MAAIGPEGQATNQWRRRLRRVAGSHTSTLPPGQPEIGAAQDNVRKATNVRRLGAAAVSSSVPIRILKMLLHNMPTRTMRRHGVADEPKSLLSDPGSHTHPLKGKYRRTVEAFEAKSCDLSRARASSRLSRQR